VIARAATPDKALMSRSTAFFVVAAVLFAMLAGSNVATPLYESYRREWHLTPFVISAVFALYTFVLVGVSWSCGRISDRFGRRPIVLVALVAGALGSLLFALATGPKWLFAARIAQGVAVGLASGAGGAALVELEPLANHRRAALIASLMFAAGGAFGPLLSGLLAQYAPHPLQLPYLVHLGSLVPLLGLALFLPETAPRVAGTTWLPRLPPLPPETRAPFAIAALSAALVWIVAGLFFSLVPSYLRVELGTRSVALGGLAPFAMLATSAVAQVTLRANERALLYTAYALLTLGMAAVVAAVPFHAVWLLMLGALVTGAGHGAGFLGAQRSVTRIAPPATRGEVLSLFYAVIFFSIGVWVLALGALASAYGFFLAFAAFGLAVVVLSICLAWALSRERSL
jgi:hypothetical protein